VHQRRQEAENASRDSTPPALHPSDGCQWSIGMIVNPYNAPSTTLHPLTQSDPKNPAKPLLILVGALFGVTAPMTIVSGLQAGLHLIAAGAVMLALSCGTIWLALREFKPVIRIATLIWGLCLVGFFAWASISAYDPNDIGGTVFFGFVLLIVAPIPILALRQPPYHPASLAN
jgi:hypothetical protein